MLENCPSINEWHKNVPRSVFFPLAAGFIVLGTWLFGFGLWATTAPIDGAVVAHGSFVATGQNKLVQHLEGGIVREILVKEGDIVKLRQPLIRLDDTTSKTKLRRLEYRSYRLLAMQARLQAELVEERKITFPADLIAKLKRADLGDILERQRLEFRVRRKRIEGEITVLRKEIQSLHENIQGYDTQIASTRKRIEIFKEELKNKQELLRKALVRRTDVMAIRRAEARAAGELGQLLGKSGDMKERIARANQQIVQVTSVAAQQATEELRKVETELDDVREQIRSARDVVERSEVQSPVSGIVVKLNYHTQGGVISPGAVLMELLPVDDELIIEARVPPGDVAYVQNDQPALVRLSALNQRVTPFIEGKVVYVSADAVSENDPRRGSTKKETPGGSFIVRVGMNQVDVKAKVPGFVPTPGMPAELYIRTGERTFSEYLLEPIANSFSRAFRER